MLKTFVARYGFTRLTVFQQSDAQGIGQILYSDVDLETLDRFQHSSSVMAQAVRGGEPLARSDAATSDQHLYIGENLIVPLADNNAPKGVAVLGGEEADVSAIARSLLHVATETAFDRAQVLPVKEAPAPAGGPLSTREAAILGWAAAGRTDAQIGEMLKISARTVRFHTDNAKRKLRVTSRIQAVTEALRLGLIKL